MVDTISLYTYSKRIDKAPGTRHQGIHKYTECVCSGFLAYILCMVLVQHTTHCKHECASYRIVESDWLRAHIVTHFTHIILISIKTNYYSYLEKWMKKNQTKNARYRTQNSPFWPMNSIEHQTPETKWELFFFFWKLFIFPPMGMTII